MSKRNRYFATDGYDYELFETKEEAKNYAEKALEEERTRPESEWDEEVVNNICWGRIVESPVPYTEEQDGETYTDYQLASSFRKKSQV
jgi:hypothetical protein